MKNNSSRYDRSSSQINNEEEESIPVKYSKHRHRGIKVAAFTFPQMTIYLKSSIDIAKYFSVYL